MGCMSMVIHKVFKNGALCGRGREYACILTEDDNMVTCPTCLELMDLAVRDGSLV